MTFRECLSQSSENRHALSSVSSSSLRNLSADPFATAVKHRSSPSDESQYTIHQRTPIAMEDATSSSYPDPEVVMSDRYRGRHYYGRIDGVNKFSGGMGVFDAENVSTGHIKSARSSLSQSYEGIDRKHWPSRRTSLTSNQLGRRDDLQALLHSKVLVHGRTWTYGSNAVKLEDAKGATPLYAAEPTVPSSDQYAHKLLPPSPKFDENPLPWEVCQPYITPYVSPYPCSHLLQTGTEDFFSRNTGMLGSIRGAQRHVKKVYVYGSELASIRFGYVPFCDDEENKRRMMSLSYPEPVLLINLRQRANFTRIRDTKRRH
jgi:hypothetical protein